MTRFLKKTDDNGDERWDVIKMLLATIGAILLAYFSWLGIVAVGAASQQDVKDTKSELKAEHDKDIQRVYEHVGGRLDNIQTTLNMIVQREINAPHEDGY